MTDPAEQYAMLIAAQARLTADAPTGYRLAIIATATHPDGHGTITIRAVSPPCPLTLQPHPDGTTRAPAGHHHWRDHTATVAAPASLDWCEAATTLALQTLATGITDDHRHAASPHN